MKQLVGFVVLALFVGGLVGACKKAPSFYTPVSLEGAESFAVEFEKLLHGCDVEGINERFDAGALMGPAAANAGLTYAQRQETIRLAKKRANFGGQFCQNVLMGSRYDLLRIRERGGDSRLLFRVLARDGINYIEFTLGHTDGTERIRIVDYYMYMSGQSGVELFTEVFGALIRKPEEMTSTVETINRMKNFVSQGNHEQAYAALNELPPRLSKKKSTMIVKVSVAGYLGDDLYAAAIREYEEAFPGDPSLDLVSIDGYLMRKQYDEALASIDRLDKRLGGDPYLDIMRSSTLFEKGDYATAKKLAEQVLASDETLEDAYWNLAGIALEQKDHDEVVRILFLLEQKLGVETNPVDIGGDPAWANFVTTDAYQTWLTGRQAATADVE